MTLQNRSARSITVLFRAHGIAPVQFSLLAGVSQTFGLVNIAT
jgi:hypothetical protein